MKPLVTIKRFSDKIQTLKLTVHEWLFFTFGTREDRRVKIELKRYNRDQKDKYVRLGKAITSPKGIILLLLVAIANKRITKPKHD